MEIDIRPYDSIADEAFLLSTWIKSYGSSPAVRAMPRPIYFIEQRLRILELLRGGEIEIKVACSKEAPELIFGYIVTNKPNTLHYLYVKGTYRNSSVARQLVAPYIGNEPLYYTHAPTEGWLYEYIKAALPNFIYNPYLLERNTR